jgi:hypothetical protein
VHLEASTKPHVHQNFESFWTNIASTMACPNSKNGPKNGLRPLGVNGDCTRFRGFVNQVRLFIFMQIQLHPHKSV